MVTAVHRQVALAVREAPGGEFGSTGLLGHVGHAAGSVLAVVEGDLGPAGSLHGDGQATGPGLSGPDAEVGWTNSGRW